MKTPSIVDKKNRNLIDIDNVKDTIYNDLEKYIKGNTDGEKASDALLYLYRIKNKQKKKKYAKDIIEKKYYSDWNDELKKYYSNLLRIFDTFRYHYFISFTRYNNTPEVNNKINEDYKKYIKKILDKPKYKSDYKNMNLLARAISIDIKRTKPNLLGFFDEYTIVDSADPIAKTIIEACENTLFFIQIINHNIFTNDKKPEENWCFKEYNAIQEGLNTENKYLVCPDLPNECDINLEYNNWFTSIKDQYHARLTEENIYDNLEKLFDEIDKFIPNMIEKAKDY